MEYCERQGEEGGNGEDVQVESMAQLSDWIESEVHSTRELMERLRDRPEELPVLLAEYWEQLAERLRGARPGTLLEGEDWVILEVLTFKEPLTASQRRSLKRVGITFEEYLGESAYLVSIKPEDFRSFGDFGSVQDWAEAFEVVRALRGLVKLGTRFKPAYKFSPGIRMLLRGMSEEGGERPGRRPDREPANLTVAFSSEIPPEQARDQLQRAGVSILDQFSRNSFLIAVEDAATLQKVSRDIPNLTVLDMPPPPPIPLLNTARPRANVDEAQQLRVLNEDTDRPRPHYDGLTGEGVRVGVADFGILAEHDDFTKDDRSRVIEGTGVGGSGAHGTHVASIIAGSGSETRNYRFPDEEETDRSGAYGLRGVAPRAGLGNYRTIYALCGLAEDCLARTKALEEILIDHQMDLTNHSYVQNCFGVYDVLASQIDELIRGDFPASDGQELIPPRPQVWSAGNYGKHSGREDCGTGFFDFRKGYYSLATAAKNTITVGSVDTRDGLPSEISSLGPTFDGRFKPDLVAPGCNDSIRWRQASELSLHENGGILAAYDPRTVKYGGICGTSMAAPIVSGIIALMMEKHRSSGVRHLLPSTYKAILVQTAHDLVMPEDADRQIVNPDTGEPLIYPRGPDFATGFGLVDAKAAVETVGDRNKWTEGKLRRGETDWYCMSVPDGSSREVRVTLAWDDKPGTPLKNPHETDGDRADFTDSVLVDDLDLAVWVPFSSGDSAGKWRYPWTRWPSAVPEWSGEWTPAPDTVRPGHIREARRDIEDHINNVEMVSVFPSDLENPAEAWWIRVKADEEQDGLIEAAKYSLAASHDFEEGQCR